MKHPPSRRRGTALVITLSILVLLAFVLVAFFVKATSTLSAEKAGGGGREASLLARSAVNLIVNDLQAEMKAGSTNLGNAWMPSAATNMLPSRRLLPGITANDTNFVNLIKQSGVPMFDGSPAVNVSGGTPTSTPSSDGRLVTPARWSTPMLTGSTLPNTPNWIYLSRDGTLEASPGTQTIGRFAYNVYDIGGLLDANAAGFAPVDGSVPAEAATKGGQIWADLRALPGISDSAFANHGSWPPQWRIPGDWADMNSTNSAGRMSWYQRSGWTRPYMGSAGSASDRMFTSRQDLIRYARNHPDTFAKDGNDRFPALQYLTTFSRDVDQPSHQPVATRPMIQFSENQGGNDAKGLDSVINPGARRSDGSALVKHRFALDNIALLATAMADTALIQKRFGLTKNGSAWIYNHGSTNQILNLEDVPQDREPDFFEILKAAIHAGSLGVQHGTSLSVSPASFYRQNIGYDDASLNYQIIQIGANIIDQADTDSYPTQVTFDGQTLAGVENLPFIDGIACVSLPEQVVTGVTLPSGYSLAGDWTGPLKAVTLLMPRLWNPHAGNPGDQTKVPVNFRVRAETSSSGADHFVQTRHNVSDVSDLGNWRNSLANAGGSGSVSAYRWNYAPMGGEDYGPGAAANPAINLDGGEIGFSLASGWQASFPNTLSDPRILSHPYTGSGFASISGTPGATEFSTISPWIKNGFGKTAAASALSSPYDVFGFPMGRSWIGPYILKNSVYKQLCNVLEVWGGPVRLILECETNVGWVAYDSAYYLPQGDNYDGYYAMVLGVSPDNMAKAIDGQFLRTFFKFDPRSKRWGGVSTHSGFLAQGDQAQSDARWRMRSMKERQTLRPGASSSSPPLGGTYADLSVNNFASSASGVWSAPVNSSSFDTAGAADIASVSVNTSSSTSSYAYLDPDGIRRRGSAAYWGGSSLDGQPMANYWDPSTGAARADVARNRPIILNRAFRSVAELGYVFRDTPWRNLDFFTSESGDSALLDFFTVHPITTDASGNLAVPITKEGAPIVAGKVNLNTRQPAVLAAILSGVARENQSSGSAPLDEATAQTIAKGIVDFTSSTATGKGPFVSLADLVGKPVSSSAYAGLSDELSTLLSSSDQMVKQRREAILRALVDGGTTRTWTVLIDVVAQSGIVPAGSAKFVPRGESRSWTSVAIDRLTTEVLDRQTESVHE